MAAKLGRWLQVEVTHAETVHELVGHAKSARSTGSTGVNEDSSRSHSIMQVGRRHQQHSSVPHALAAALHDVNTAAELANLNAHLRRGVSPLSGACVAAPK